MKAFISYRALLPKKEVINCYLFLFLQFQSENMKAMTTHNSAYSGRLNPDKTVRPKNHSWVFVEISDKNTN